MEKITAVFCLLAVMGVISARVSETGVTTRAVSDGNATAEIGSSSAISSTTRFPSPDNHTSKAITQASPDSNMTTETNGTSKEQWTTPDSDNSTKTTRKSENPPNPGSEPKMPTTVSTKTSKKVMPKLTTTQKTKTSSNPPTTVKPHSSHKKTYITILIIIIIICILAVMAFCCVQNKTRKFSLERHRKSEDAQIPLSAADPEVFEAVSLKDMQTFTAVGDSATPADGVEKQDGDKAPPKDNQQEKEGSTDTQATAPLTEKVDELTVVDLNDGEPAISTKTSVESLNEPLNENNSNNRAWASAYGASRSFTEICLNDLH